MNKSSMKKVSEVIKNNSSGFSHKDLISNKRFGVSPGTGRTAITKLLFNKCIKKDRSEGNRTIYKVIAPLKFNDVDTLKNIINKTLKKIDVERFSFNDFLDNLTLNERSKLNENSLRTNFYKIVNKRDIIRLGKDLYQLPMGKVSNNDVKLVEENPVKEKPVKENKPVENTINKINVVETGKSVISYIQDLQNDNIRLNKKVNELVETNKSLVQNELQIIQQKNQELGRFVKELQIKNNDLIKCKRSYVTNIAHNKIVSTLHNQISVLKNQNSIQNKGITLNSLSELKNISLRKR